jgi:hypothetical protein
VEGSLQQESALLVNGNLALDDQTDVARRSRLVREELVQHAMQVHGRRQDFLVALAHDVRVDTVQQFIDLVMKFEVPGARDDWRDEQAIVDSGLAELTQALGRPADMLVRAPEHCCPGMLELGDLSILVDHQVQVVQLDQLNLVGVGLLAEPEKLDAP